MPLATSSDRYTIISADSHAGGSHEQYREYLEPAYREEFDAWRAVYKNPFKDLLDDKRTRNWDSDRRIAEQDSDGVVAEVVFPNTVPPFFPTGAVVVRPPSADDYRRRLAGLRAHNRWLADWCSLAPQRRAGIAQILLNDVDEAVADVHRAADAGLRGGVLIPSIPPDFTGLKPIYDPIYDPIWRACEQRGLPVNSHGGSGNPDYGRYPFATFLFVAETGFFSQRPLVHLLISGVFERFPRLKFVVTEQGCDWLPAMLARLDQFHTQASSGRVGELAYDPSALTRAKPSELFVRNVWVGVSFPKPSDAQVCRQVGLDRFLWGSDYPHHEGTYPYTREHLRQVFSQTPPDELRRILAGNAADVYGFDLNALSEIAARVGPSVEEIRVPLDKVPADATSPAFFA